MAYPSYNVFVNYLAASRKASLVSFGMFNPDDNLSFIFAIGIGGTSGTPEGLVGTVDGVNTVFTTPAAVVNGCSVFRNGVLQDPAVAYVLVGSTITFNSANIPQVGDDLQAIVS